MTKKYYIAIASVLKYCRPSKTAKLKGYDDRLMVWEGIVEELAELFHSDNSLFDYARFYQACDYQQAE